MMSRSSHRLAARIGGVVAGVLTLSAVAVGTAAADIRLNTLSLGPDSPISAGPYRWVLQSSDGNFVQYDSNNQPVRFSGVSSPKVDHVEFQRPDCNVVGYAGGQAVWQSGRTQPDANGRCGFNFGNDGQLTVTNSSGRVIWNFVRDGVRGV